MISVFTELTDGFNWGKFMVGRFDEGEWQRRSSVDGSVLLKGRGWTDRHLFVFDLQTGEGGIFYPSGSAKADLDKHRVHVCPMFEVFLTWLYAHPEHCADIHTLPPLIPIKRSQTRGHNAIYGYRRPGPQGAG